MKVGHVFNEFCPRNSVLRYWPVANPHVESAVYCFRRTNADMFPHDEVYSEAFADRLRSFGGVARKVTKPLASAIHRRCWRQFLRRSKVDVLHVQFGDKAVRFLPMLNRSSLPLVVTFRGSDINCATYSDSKRAGLKQLFARTALCHFVSHDLREKAISLGCPPEIARTIHVGAPARADADLALHSSRVKNCRFFCVASLLPCKGHETLLSAFSRISGTCPESTLHLIGEGPLEPRLRWVSSQLGIAERVRFYGHIENAKVVETLRANADVVILVSQHDDAGNEEGLPTSLQEAGSIGLPCIGTDCGGIGELIIDGETGRLVSQRDVASVAEAMIELATSPLSRKEMGVTAFERVRENFNLDRFYQMITDSYSEVTAGERRRNSTETEVATA